MTQTKLKLIVFDWDGTLVDSAGLIVHSIQSACADLGLDVPDEMACRRIIGLGLGEALATLLPELPSSDHERLVDRYRHHYLGRDESTRLFQGAGELVAELAEEGFFLAIATGKSRVGLERSLGHTGIGGHFLASRCADQCRSKPHPQMLLELMDQLGATPEETIMIGDTVHDLNMANNAGVASLAATYGAYPKDELCALEPLACCDDIGEVGAWLRRLA